jgi:hypothetical protein
VARSTEAKALGINMVQPMFSMRQFYRQDGVVFCLNYALYGSKNY